MNAGDKPKPINPEDFEHLRQSEDVWKLWYIDGDGNKIYKTIIHIRGVHYLESVLNANKIHRYYFQYTATDYQLEYDWHMELYEASPSCAKNNGTTGWKDATS